MKFSYDFLGSLFENPDLRRLPVVYQTIAVHTIEKIASEFMESGKAIMREDDKE